MSDELEHAQGEANRLADQVESLRGQNNTLSDCVNSLRVARAKMQQQRDQLLTAARRIPRNGGTLVAGIWIDLDAAIANCADARETVGSLRAAIASAGARLEDRLERARDESDYDTVVAVRDTAGSLISGFNVTHMEAAAIIAELDALAASGGPLSDTDDPAYTPELAEV
jgi:hypothetical protein